MKATYTTFTVRSLVGRLRGDVNITALITETKACSAVLQLLQLDLLLILFWNGHGSTRILLITLWCQQKQSANKLRRDLYLNRGDTKQPSTKEASRNAKITNIVQSYISSDPDKTLRGIAFNYM